MKDYTIKHEPASDSYRRMLHFAPTLCNQILLVIRTGNRIDPHALAVLESLQPQCLSAEERSQWPGTTLYGHTAHVRQYVLNEQSLSILSNSAHRLFEWLQPELPEDLCLLRSNDMPWLVSICHERDAFLRMTEDEYLAFRRQCPNVVLDEGVEADAMH